ncbi:MAG: hypothetical protein ACLVCI_00130 [Varibaculum timonense]
MSNPEQVRIPDANNQGGANWPFATPQVPSSSSPQTMSVSGQPAPAFPAPAAPPAQNVPQYTQPSTASAPYTPAGFNPLPASSQVASSLEQPSANQPVSTPAEVPSVQQQPSNSLPAAVTGLSETTELAALPIVDPVLEQVSVQQASSNIAENSSAATAHSEPEPEKNEGSTTSKVKDLQVSAVEIKQSLHQQAQTPWWLDALVALSLAGVMVFNGFGMNLGMRIGSLIVMVIALVLITWYQGDAQEKSNTFLAAVLLGTVCGFLSGLIVVAASLYMVSPIPAWYPWVLWLVSAVLLYLTYRGFRDWVMRKLNQKSEK